MTGPVNEQPSAPLEAARTMLGVSHVQLWIDYVGLGGSLPLPLVRAFLDGEIKVRDYDHDVLTHALNEYFMDQVSSFPLLYADEPRYN